MMLKGILFIYLLTDLFIYLGENCLVLLTLCQISTNNISSLFHLRKQTKPVWFSAFFDSFFYCPTCFQFLSLKRFSSLPAPLQLHYQRSPT